MHGATAANGHRNDAASVLRLQLSPEVTRENSEFTTPGQMTIIVSDVITGWRTWAKHQLKTFNVVNVITLVLTLVLYFHVQSTVEDLTRRTNSLASNSEAINNQLAVAEDRMKKLDASLSVVGTLLQSPNAQYLLGFNDTIANLTDASKVLRTDLDETRSGAAEVTLQVRDLLPRVDILRRNTEEYQRVHGFDARLWNRRAPSGWSLITDWTSTTARVMGVQVSDLDPATGLYRIPFAGTYCFQAGGWIGNASEFYHRIGLDVFAIIDGVEHSLGIGGGLMSHLDNSPFPTHSVFAWLPAGAQVGLRLYCQAPECILGWPAPSALSSGYHFFFRGHFIGKNLPSDGPSASMP